MCGAPGGAPRSYWDAKLVLHEAAHGAMGNEDRERFLEAVANTERALLNRSTASQRHYARRSKECRARLIGYGMKANAVPWRWQLRILSWLVPFPWNVVIPAIVFAVDHMLAATEEAVANGS